MKMGTPYCSPGFGDGGKPWGPHSRGWGMQTLRQWPQTVTCKLYPLPFSVQVRFREGELPEAAPGVHELVGGERDVPCVPTRRAQDGVDGPLCQRARRPVQHVLRAVLGGGQQRAGHAPEAHHHRAPQRRQVAALLRLRIRRAQQESPRDARQRRKVFLILFIAS